DVMGQLEKVKAATQTLTAAGIKVSLFIDADREQIDAAKACGAPFIELHTGHYADATCEVDQQNELTKIAAAASSAADQGIMVNAGHGLTYHNVAAIAAIPEIYELNIGHAIIGRAVFDGLSKAVADMKAVMDDARR
ncbi:pyridoxine 5'-phosphate synthase, partial [Vibrio diabolicus]|uniref:pyridoxine 5'-phosphate synthase n=1 Tax=Vibrio diabolicus TaxID=50719 RepID=UPI00211B50DE|nr:pyridoxine 5'-phosphate synthase [Vibrio diabolicus]